MASDLVEPHGQTAIYCGLLLLYDADCALCNRSVQFVLRHERPARRNSRETRLRFAPLDGQYGAALRRRLPELADVDSLIWISPAQIESDAVLSVLRYLGGVWALIAAIGRCIPKPIRDALYRFVARHRKRGNLNNAQACLLPGPELQSRFLD